MGTDTNTYDYVNIWKLSVQTKRDINSKKKMHEQNNFLKSVLGSLLEEKKSKVDLYRFPVYKIESNTIIKY